MKRIAPEFVVKRMHELLQQKQTINPKHNLLRERLIDFGNRFLSQEEFDELIWILNESGIKLEPSSAVSTVKPFQQSQTDNQVVEEIVLEETGEPIELESEEEQSVSSAPQKPSNQKDAELNWIRKNFESLNDRLTEMEQRMSQMERKETDEEEKALPKVMVKQTSPPPPPEVDLINDESTYVVGFVRDFEFPISTPEDVERIESGITNDGEYFRQVTAGVREVYEKTKASGWRSVFDHIFHRSVMHHYHCQANLFQSAVMRDGTVRKPTHAMRLFNDVLNEAFYEHDAAEIEQELRKWFGVVRSYNRVTKNRAKKRQSENLKDESGDWTIEASIEQKPRLMKFQYKS